MLQDAQGLEVTPNSPEAVAAIDQFIEQSHVTAAIRRLFCKALRLTQPVPWQTLMRQPITFP